MHLNSQEVVHFTLCSYTKIILILCINRIYYMYMYIIFFISTFYINLSIFVHCLYPLHFYHMHREALIAYSLQSFTATHCI